MSRETSEYQALLRMSAEVGADPALVQAAGGNTSIKQDGILWIKASGTWLMNALSQDIMVPVALKSLMNALKNNDPAVEKAQAFVLNDQNPRDLRPSIETTVHAVFPHAIVVHVHCVETIAVASRVDATEILEPLLAEFNWRYVPYTKPGITLSRSIAESLYEDGNPADVVVLGNHGLVVAADTVEDARALLMRVCAVLKQPVRAAPEFDHAALEKLLTQSDYEKPENIESHGVAMDSIALDIACGGSLYPDHVIFLGEGSVVANEHETPDQVAARYVANNQPPPVSIIFPNIGVAMKTGCGGGAHALARCLADVTARLPGKDVVNYLTPEQNDELLNWDAEKYRRALNKKDLKNKEQTADTVAAND